MNKYDSVYNAPRGSYYSGQHHMKRPAISWGAVVAGIVTSFMVAVVLTMLLMGLGLSSFDMQADNPGSTAGLSLGIGSLVIMVISLFAGSYLAGRLSGRSGLVHGFLNWACLSVLAFVLSAMAISSAVKLSSSLVGSAFNLGAAGVAQNPDQVKEGYNKLKANGVQGNVQNALKNYGLNDDFLDQYQSDMKAKLDGKTYGDEFINNYKQALDEAQKVSAKAVEDFKNNPDNGQAIADKLKTDLEAISGRMASPVDGTTIQNKLLADNVASDKAQAMTQDAINKINIARVETRNKIMDARANIIKAQDNLNNLSQNAGDMFENATNKVGHGAWWAFLSSIIGAAISAFAGKLGAKSRHTHTNDHYELQPMHRNNHNYRNCDSHVNTHPTNADFVSDVKIRNQEWNDKRNL